MRAHVHTQLAGVEPATRVAAEPFLRHGHIIGSGRGYFKLAPGLVMARSIDGAVIDEGGTRGERALVRTLRVAALLRCCCARARKGVWGVRAHADHQASMLRSARTLWRRRLDLTTKPRRVCRRSLHLVARRACQTGAASCSVCMPRQPIRRTSALTCCM